MNEVSIIINGVRYDVSKSSCNKKEVCRKCDLESYCDNALYFTTICQMFGITEEDIHFKKSDKKFEI